MPMLRGYEAVGVNSKTVCCVVASQPSVSQLCLRQSTDKTAKRDYYLIPPVAGLVVYLDAAPFPLFF